MTGEISGELSEAMRRAGISNSTSQAWAAVAAAHALEKIADALTIIANKG